MFGSKQDKIEKAVEKKKIGELIKFTQDKDPSIILAAIAGLGKIKEDDAFNALVPFLSSTVTEQRAAAATALGELGNGHAKAFLLHAAQVEKDPAAKKTIETASGKLRDY